MMHETKQRTERDAFVTCLDIYGDKRMTKENSGSEMIINIQWDSSMKLTEIVLESNC